MPYTTATFTRLDKNADGGSTIILTYTGDNGLPPVEYAYPVNAASPPTADYMRGIAMARIAILNNSLSFNASVTPFIGAVLDTTTPLPTPAATFGRFMAATAPFTPGATPQDVFTITGSSTKRIDVVRIGLSTVQTTAGMNAWSLVKRSTANIGGTSAVITGVPTEKTYPAATATVRQYTVNPTAGTLVGTLWSGRVAAPALATAFTGPYECVVDGPATLVGTGDVLAWNLAGIALPAGLSVQATVWWNESA